MFIVLLKISHWTSGPWRLSEKTKERYHQCRNTECSCTFATHETVDRLIVRPQLVAVVAVTE
ncbi:MULTISPECIES: ogr/Delta-like zinc finger family protein [unclassified Serratia (in: enterobacteria)]|uniref:ogr/Delta-like zinc finger family protein n=1 Tax=unclassified Serratia (in: enterobacteria) TaxID=2647522 RepID=UPI0009072FC3|nr:MULTISPECIES: ogr/Delta-like zinc finger family protein [unclassified Serratia (in: enterobacteria)]